MAEKEEERMIFYKDSLIMAAYTHARGSSSDDKARAGWIQLLIFKWFTLCDLCSMTEITTQSCTSGFDRDCWVPLTFLPFSLTKKRFVSQTKSCLEPSQL